MNITRTTTSDILTNLAEQGELILRTMRPDMNPGPGVLEWEALWVATGTLMANGLLDPDRAAQFKSSPEYEDKTSEAHPLPERIEKYLISYWHSVAWRIDQLREWADQP